MSENEIRVDFLGRRAIIASNRGKRPHDFKVSSYRKTVDPHACFFCPGNEHMTPKEVSRFGRTPSKWEVRCFPNRFFALDKSFSSGYGVHELVVETPDHSLTFSKIAERDMELMFEMFAERTNEFMKDPKITYVSIFKNEGKEAGASIEHSHSQILTVPYKPDTIAIREAASSRNCMFCQVPKMEKQMVIYEDAQVFAYCPYVSQFAFQAAIVPKRHMKGLKDLNSKEVISLTRALRGITGYYDDVLGYAPYNILYYSAARDSKDFHFHIDLVPRIATIAGFELGANTFINIMPPEVAAPAIREFVSKM